MISSEKECILLWGIELKDLGGGGGDWQSVGRTCKGGKGRILNWAKPPDTQLITLNKTFAQLESSNLQQSSLETMMELDECSLINQNYKGY